MKRDPIEKILKLAQVQQLMEGPIQQEREMNMRQMLEMAKLDEMRAGREGGMELDERRLAQQGEQFGQANEHQKALQQLGFAHEDEIQNRESSRARSFQGAAFGHAERLADLQNRREENRFAQAHELQQKGLALQGQDLEMRRGLGQGQVNADMLRAALAAMNPGTGILPPEAEYALSKIPGFGEGLNQFKTGMINDEVDAFLPQYNAALSGGPEAVAALSPMINAKPPAFRKALEAKAKASPQKPKEPFLSPSVKRALQMTPPFNALFPPTN